MVSISELADMAALMERYGITVLKNGEVEMQRPLVMVDKGEVSEAGSVPVKEPRRGADGLSAEEQLDAYGRTYDAE